MPETLQGKPPNWLIPYSQWPDIEVRTIKSLGLDVEGARTDPRRLLHPDVRRQPRARDYPLPESHAELEIIAGLPIKPVGYREEGPPEGRYVARAIWHLRHKPRVGGLMSVRDKRARIAVGQLQAIEAAKREAVAEVSEIRAVVRVARSTLLQTAQEFDEAFGMIARSFNESKPLPNGEIVSVKDLINAYRGFYTHMDKLGGPITKDMEEEAEEVVYAQAVEAARARIARTIRTAIPAQVANA